MFLIRFHFFVFFFAIFDQFATLEIFLGKKIMFFEPFVVTMTSLCFENTVENRRHRTLLVFNIKRQVGLSFDVIDV